MSQQIMYKFRLYVAPGHQNSIQALANLKSICRTHIPDCYEIELVNILKEPMRALAEGIFMTPTLIKLAPVPVQHIVGSLFQTEIVVHALGLTDSD